MADEHVRSELARVIDAARQTAGVPSRAIAAILVLAQQMGAFGASFDLSLAKARARIPYIAPSASRELLRQIKEQVAYGRLHYEFRVNGHHFSAAALKTEIDAMPALVGASNYDQQNMFLYVLLRAFTPHARDILIETGASLLFSRVPPASETLAIKTRFSKAAPLDASSAASLIVATLATVQFEFYVVLARPNEPPPLKGAPPPARERIVEEAEPFVQNVVGLRALIDKAEAEYRRDTEAKTQATVQSTRVAESHAVAAKQPRVARASYSSDDMPLPDEARRRFVAPAIALASAPASDPAAAPEEYDSMAVAPASDSPFDDDDDDGQRGIVECKPLPAPRGYAAALMQNVLVAALARELGLPVPFASPTEALVVARILLIMVFGGTEWRHLLRSEFVGHPRILARIDTLQREHIKSITIRDVAMLVAPFKTATPLPASLRSLLKSMPHASETVQALWRDAPLYMSALLFWGGSMSTLAIVEPDSVKRRDVASALLRFKEARPGQALPDDVRHELVCRFPRA